MSPHDELLESLEDQRQVIDAALDAFWDSIAASCPYIKTGDMDPGAEAQFRMAATEAVAVWIRINQPSECEDV